MQPVTTVATLDSGVNYHILATQHSFQLRLIIREKLTKLPSLVCVFVVFFWLTLHLDGDFSLLKLLVCFSLFLKVHCSYNFPPKDTNITVNGEVVTTLQPLHTVLRVLTVQTSSFIYEHSGHSRQFRRNSNKTHQEFLVQS